MKNTLILTLLLFFVTLTNFSQEIVPIEEQYDYEHQGLPYYLKDVNNLFDKFIGEWEFIDTSHYLKIKFYKVEAINESSYPKETYDEIRSFLLYKEKQGNVWTIIYNTYPLNFTSADLNNQYFNNGDGIKGNIIYENFDKIKLNYYEPALPCTNQLNCNVSLTFTNTSNNPQLLWQIDGICYGTTTKEPCSSIITSTIQDHRIPAQLTLNKL